MSFLFVDRIIQSSPGEWIKGIKHITTEDKYLALDEEGRAYFIPSLIGETLGQLVAWNVMKFHDFNLRPVAGVVDTAKLHRPAYVGETLLLESFIDLLDEQVVQYHSLARVGEEPVFSIEGALGPLLPMHNFIHSIEVQNQYAEINRPGDWSLVEENAPQSDFELAHQAVSTYTLNFDRILSCEPGLSLVAEKRVTRAAPYFRDHFPLKPVLPMTVLLESKLQLAQKFIALASYNSKFRVIEMRKIKMNEFVSPGEIIICYVKVKQQSEDQLILNFRSEVEGKRVCVVDVVLSSEGI